jgi:hypothetical protein
LATDGPAQLAVAIVSVAMLAALSTQVQYTEARPAQKHALPKQCLRKA